MRPSGHEVEPPTSKSIDAIGTGRVLSPFAPGLAGRVNARRAIIRPGWRTVGCGA